MTVSIMQRGTILSASTARPKSAVVVGNGPVSITPRLPACLLHASFRGFANAARIDDAVLQELSSFLS